LKNLLFILIFPLLLAAAEDPCRTTLIVADRRNAVDVLLPEFVAEALSGHDSKLLATAMEVAHRQAPTDPIERAKLAIEFISRNGGTWAREATPLSADGKKAQHKGQPFNELAPAVFPGQEPMRRTVDFVNGKWNGEVWQPPSGSQVLVILLPGSGAHYSHAGSTLEIGSIFSKVNAIQKADPASTKFHQELRRQMGDNHVIVAVDAIEVPGTLTGPDHRYFESRGAIAEWLGEMIAARRQAAGNIPTVVIARSSFGGIIPQVAKDRPGLLDGMILAGPTHPDPSLGLNASYLFALSEHLNKVEGETIGNGPGYHVANQAFADANWSLSDKPMSGVPTMVLVGSNDQESPPGARAFFRAHTDYRIIEGASHNPYINQRGTKDVALNSYGITYAFLKKIVSAAAERP